LSTVEAQYSTGQKTLVPPALPANMNKAELEELFASCLSRVQKSARHFMQDSPDCEDVAQEALMAAFRKLGQFEGRSQFTTWLHSIVKNAARTHRRWRNCRPQCSLEEELGEEGDSIGAKSCVDLGPNPEEVCVIKERSWILLEVLADMPERYQRVMRICDVEGVAPKRAAKRLGISSSSLKANLFRARRMAARRIRNRVFGGRREPGVLCDGILRLVPSPGIRRRRDQTCSTAA
jgi:RNA polymerase sigma-70 factor, ECF subfamily